MMAFSVVLSASQPLAGRAATQAPDDIPDGPGKAAAMQVCGTCHSASAITEQLRTAKEWSRTIDDMASYGATATEAQLEDVLKYAVTVAGKVNVNTAPAAELAPVLDVPDGVAAAVERYRAEHGRFMSLDDLKKVPGVDATRLESRKRRIEF